MGLLQETKRAQDFLMTYNQAMEKFEERYGAATITKAAQDIARNIMHVLTKRQIPPCELRDCLNGEVIDETSLWNILTGAALPRPAELYAVAVVIGVPPEELLEGGGYPNQELLSSSSGWLETIMRRRCRVFCRNVAALTDYDKDSDEPAAKINMERHLWQLLRSGSEPLTHDIIKDTLRALHCEKNPEIVSMPARTVPHGYPMAVLQTDGTIDMQAFAFNLRTLMRMTMISLSSIKTSTGRPVSYILGLMDGEQPRGGMRELHEFAGRIGVESRRLLGDSPKTETEDEEGSVSPGPTAAARKKQIAALNVRALMKKEAEEGRGAVHIRQRLLNTKIPLGKIWMGEFDADAPECSTQKVATVLETTEQDLSRADILSAEHTEQMLGEILRAIEQESNPRRQAIMKMLIEEQAAG